MDLCGHIGSRRLAGFVRSAFDREQALGAVLGAISLTATVEAEQPLAPQQPHHGGDVDQQRAEAECVTFSVSSYTSSGRNTHVAITAKYSPSASSATNPRPPLTRSARSLPARSRSTSASSTTVKTPVRCVGSASSCRGSSRSGGQRPDQRQLTLKGLLQPLLRTTHLRHPNGQQHEDGGPNHPLYRQQPHDQPIPQQPAPRDLRCRARRTAATRGPDHERLTPQAAPRLPHRRVSAQPIPQLGLIGRKCRVPTQAARS